MFKVISALPLLRIQSSSSVAAPNHGTKNLRQERLDKGMLRRTASSAPYFDVKLQNNTGRDQRIILVKGPAAEANPVAFNGEVLLSATDNLSVKKMKLVLVGELKLRWSDDMMKSKYPGHQMPQKYEKKVWRQEYSNFELPEKVSRSNPGSRLGSPASSLTNLSSYFQSNGAGGGAGNGQRHLSPHSAMNHVRSSNSLTSLTSHFSGPHHHHNHREPQSQSRESSPEPVVAGADSSTGRSDHSPRRSMSSSANAERSRSPSAQPQLVNGNYVFPFEIVVPGDIPESIEGNPFVSLSYFVHATAERGGLRSNPTAKKHVRVIRTIGVDTYDFAQTVSIENRWPGKVEYKIFVPSKAVAMGSKLHVEFNLIPLDKGLRLGKIRTEIVEYVILVSPTSISQHHEERVVMKQSFMPPSRFRDDDTLDQWEFSQPVDIPGSLSRLTQDVLMEPYVRVTHKLKMNIALVNRDGHTSELRASLPIHVFISPRVPVSAIEPELHVRSEQSIFDAPSANVDATEAPPLYSERLYDRLYSEMPTPIESPGSPISQSVPSTPGPSVNSLEDLDPHQRAQLNAGLRALALSQSMAQRAQRPNFSRNVSGIDVQALSRVPSYEHALHDQATTDTPPTYED